MNSKQDPHVAKISYEKPAAADLGPAAPVVGASCGAGDVINNGEVCLPVGNSATDTCQAGYGRT